MALPLGMHLCDTALTPIITSARTHNQLEALTLLANASLTSHAAALRFGLGDARRILVEHLPEPLSPLSSSSTSSPPQQTSSPPRHGPITIHTYIRPSDTIALDTMTSPMSNVSPTSLVPPPMLLGVAVGGPSDDISRVHKTSAQLERAGKEFQTEWESGAGIGIGIDAGEGSAPGWRQAFGSLGAAGDGGVGGEVGLGVNGEEYARRPSARRQFDADSDDSDAS